MINKKLDKVDYRILTLLREDSRISLKELAKVANVSIPTARTRIINLKKLGIIKLTVSIELQSITNQITVFILLKTKLPNIKSVLEQLNKIVEISEIYITTGKSDIILKIYAPNMQSIEKIIIEKIGKLEGVETSESNFVMETVKNVSGPILRPNFGFEIECQNCGGLVRDKYSAKIEDKDEFFCSEKCISEYIRKS